MRIVWRWPTKSSRSTSWRAGWPVATATSATRASAWRTARTPSSSICPIRGWSYRSRTAPFGVLVSVHRDLDEILMWSIWIGSIVMRISFDDHPDLQSLTIRSSSSGSRICCFSPCIEQVQRTVQALQICSFIDVQTIECVNRPFEFRPLVYKSLNLDGVSILVEMLIGCSWRHLVEFSFSNSFWTSRDLAIFLWITQSRENLAD